MALPSSVLPLAVQRKETIIMKHPRSTGPRHLAVTYRQRASDLREMARHLAMEVQWYSGMAGA